MIPSNAAGSLSQTFCMPLTMNPAAKPATRAPRNADGTPPPGEANVEPDAARAPPTKPTTRAGRSAILRAINPARIGSMKPNAVPPIDLNHAATGVLEPKLLGSIE